MFKNCLSWYLIVALFIISIASSAEGAFSPSEILVLPEAQKTADLNKIRTFLETKLVRQRLENLGLSPDEIKARLSQLSDSQMHRIAQQLDGLRVGGDGLGIIIALLVIAILVVLLIQLSGHRVVVQ